MDKRVEVAVARAMCRQQSQITKAQALELGMTESEIRTRHESGLWVIVAGGVYRSAEVPVTWLQRGMAACLIAGADAVLSHHSAAVVWGLTGFRPGPIQITVPAGRSGRNSIARVHRVKELPKSDVTRRDGVRITRAIPTLFDIAADVSFDLLADAVDDAVIRRIARLEDLRSRAVVARSHGSANLRRVLEAWPPGPLPGHLNEMRMTRWLLAHGAPLGERQYVIRDHRGRFVAQVDRAWPAAKVVLETESMRWHGTPRGLRRDEGRYPRIRALGWRLFTPEPGDDLTPLLRALQCAELAA